MIQPRRTNRRFTRRMVIAPKDMGPEIERVLHGPTPAPVIYSTVTRESLTSRISRRLPALGFVLVLTGPFVASGIWGAL